VALEQRVDRLEAAIAQVLEALARLAEAQARTEQRVQELAAAQARTEERVGRLEDRVGRLEDRVARVEEALVRLAEAQARTEQRVEELARAQARTEQRVEELARAQARTEQAVVTLAQQVGRLSETLEFTLEDLARELTPAYLAQRYGIVVGALKRRFFFLDGEEVEVDFYGEGTRDSEAVAIIGEVRSRIYGRDVDDAAKRAERLAPQVPGKPVPVLFGFVIHPSAREAAARTGAVVISSVGR
jgi:hypothetical protein